MFLIRVAAAMPEPRPTGTHTYTCAMQQCIITCSAAPWPGLVYLVPHTPDQGPGHTSTASRNGATWLPGLSWPGCSLSPPPSTYSRAETPRVPDSSKQKRQSFLFRTGGLLPHCGPILPLGLRFPDVLQVLLEATHRLDVANVQAEIPLFAVHHAQTERLHPRPPFERPLLVSELARCREDEALERDHHLRPMRLRLEEVLVQVL
mmetsp:Transcript_9367/g.27494  ORF Transcript_9367/g.27494 Transcript_9367/m.27494 type:complete len:205 (+) Transcript_9367:113-727(+)